MSKNRLVKVIRSSGSRPLVAVKTQRNDLCPCGSGKKFKKCCNSQTRYYFKQDKK